MRLQFIYETPAEAEYDLKDAEAIPEPVLHSDLKDADEQIYSNCFTK